MNLPIYEPVVFRGVDQTRNNGLLGNPATKDFYLLWAGKWQSGIKYRAYVIVQYNNALWLNGGENTYDEPGASDKWEELIAGGEEVPISFALANEIIGAYSWAKLTNDGKWANTNNQENKVVAIVQQSLTAGQLGSGVTSGLVENESWDLQIGKYFLRPDGSMTASVPATGHIILLGEALSPTLFSVQIQHIVNLGD